MNLFTCWGDQDESYVGVFMQIESFKTQHPMFFILVSLDLGADTLDEVNSTTKSMSAWLLTEWQRLI
jgi:hypothetical protein